MRHQENFGAAHLSAADGVVTHKSHSVVSDHPVRSNREASRHFLNVASTPPHEDGNTLAQKNLLEKTRSDTFVTQRHQDRKKGYKYS
jgi:hypothetical protein